MIRSPDVPSLRFCPFRKDDQLLASLGQIAIARTGSEIVLRLDCSANALNPGGFVHGGTLATLFDVALYEVACAAFQVAAVTSALELKFFRPGVPGTALYVATRTLRAGRTLSTISGSAFQNDALIAFATGQFVRASSVPVDAAPSMMPKDLE